MKYELHADEEGIMNAVRVRRSEVRAVDLLTGRYGLWRERGGYAQEGILGSENRIRLRISVTNGQTHVEL